jgi:hypothetical protein
MLSLSKRKRELDTSLRERKIRFRVRFDRLLKKSLFLQAPCGYFAVITISSCTPQNHRHD